MLPEELQQGDSDLYLARCMYLVAELAPNKDQELSEEIIIISKVRIT